MKDIISPEEKLLRLIRGQKKQGAQTPISKSAASAIKISWGNRKILIWILTASCIYLFISLLYPFIGLRRISLPKDNPQKTLEPISEQKTETKPFEFYQQGITGRRIFSNANAQADAVPASAAGVDLAKDINLVGIIAGENPQAIVEDKKTLKTYYVTKGQFVGEMQIDDIREGKIIVNYRGQKYELYL